RVRAAFAEAEQGCRALPLRKPRQRPLDINARGGVRRRGVLLDLVRHPAPSTPAAEELAPGDAQQPALVAAPAAPAASHPPRLKERLLCQVVRALPAREPRQEGA